MRGIHIQSVGNDKNKTLPKLYLITNNLEKYENTYVPKYDEYFKPVVFKNLLPKDKLGINPTYFDKSTGNYWLMMNVDRSVSNLYIVQYFPGSAGHFLQTCLGFSDSILKDVSKQQKIDYVTNLYEYGIKNNIWTDVRISCLSEESINNNQICFTTTHSYYKNFNNDLNTESMLNFYYNAKVISIVNNNIFVILRQYFMRNMIDISFTELLNLDKNSKLNLIKSLLKKDKIQNNSSKIFSTWKNEFNLKKLFEYSNTQIVLRDKDFSWDVESLYSLDSFIISIKNLYNNMNLSGFDSEVIEYCYNLWIKCSDNFVLNKK